MHKRGLCRHVVFVCVSVTFVSCVKTKNIIGDFYKIWPIAKSGNFWYKFAYKGQELSCRKQIAHQLHTQYFNGIYKPNYPMALKSRLRVTQNHWKWNDWIDHTRLTVSRVI